MGRQKPSLVETVINLSNEMLQHKMDMTLKENLVVEVYLSPLAFRNQTWSTLLRFPSKTVYIKYNLVSIVILFLTSLLIKRVLKVLAETTAAF